MPWNVDKDVSKFSSSSERSDPPRTHSTTGDAKTMSSQLRACISEAQHKAKYNCFAQYGKTIWLKLCNTSGKNEETSKWSFSRCLWQAGFPRNTEDSTLAVLAHSQKKSGLPFSKPTFAELFLVNAWLESILVLTMTARGEPQSLPKSLCPFLSKMQQSVLKLLGCCLVYMWL